MLPALLLMSTMFDADAAKPPQRPEALAEITVRSGDDASTWVLTLHRRFRHRRLGDGPHLAQPSTRLQVDLDKGEGEVLWLVGHHLRSINEPGDVTWTGSLLVELPPDGTGPTRALWHEDRMAVPTELYAGAGTLGQVPPGGAAALSLVLRHVEHDEVVEIDGIVRR